MSRTTLPTALLTTVLCVGLLTSTQAQTKVYRVSGQQPAPFPNTATSAKPLANIQTAYSADGAPSPYEAAPQPGPASRMPAQYPYLNAPMYPVPRPDIPYQLGGAVITNQALAPQEMLHPHQYRALYPPFYYKVSGKWIVMPGGVWTRERWELKGTEVKVKYHGRIQLRSLFWPPAIR